MASTVIYSSLNASSRSSFPTPSSSSHTKNYSAYRPRRHARTLSSSSTLGTRLSTNRESRKIPTSKSYRRGSITCTASSPSVLPSALLFDCDGVLVDTEKDGHRTSFNDTFAEVQFTTCLYMCSLGVFIIGFDNVLRVAFYDFSEFVQVI
ncbi:haloacid dehalogenase-like hydrolase (HAD) superfamily protein [Actinidia rufa]|uniref:Haloacid dehalogenase-like hydrolase (HAD) superfamily protein n=1 Tax=Actinidia rufa TaxID=165716 RepID=A0A7J0GAP9_9ERIC|nr:haloacid dehalogenase-like hydrolase (HAD) superfamily protein [Actinidia rufa]